MTPLTSSLALATAVLTAVSFQNPTPASAPQVGGALT